MDNRHYSQQLAFGTVQGNLHAVSSSLRVACSGRSRLAQTLCLCEYTNLLIEMGLKYVSHCRGNKQGKLPSVAVAACIVPAPLSSSRSAPLEPPDEQQISGVLHPSPTVTPPASATCNPVWNHCLSCGCAAGQLQSGLLQLALLNETDGTVMTRQAAEKC